MHLIWLFPCKIYPEKHEYETVVPQLYGPDVGFLLELATDGGLPHWQKSEQESKRVSATIDTFIILHISK